MKNAVLCGPVLPNILTPGGLQRALRGDVAHRTYCTGSASFLTAAADASTTVATLTGSGCVKKLWFTTSDPATGWFSYLDIYVDGEVTASIQLETGTLWMTHGGTDLTRHALTHNWEGSYRFGGQTMGLLRYPIPYSNGLVIKLRNPANAAIGIAPNTAFFFNTYYTSDVISPLRLKAWQVDWNNAVTLAYDALYTFATVASGPGYFVHHSLMQDSFNALTSLERNYQWYDAGVKIGETSGTEDFFLDSYYWGDVVQNGHTPPKNTPGASYAYRSVASQDFDGLRIYAARDMLADDGGYRFTNGGDLKWNNDGGTPGNGVNFKQTTLGYIGA